MQTLLERISSEQNYEKVGAVPANRPGTRYIFGQSRFRSRNRLSSSGFLRPISNQTQNCRSPSQRDLTSCPLILRTPFFTEEAHNITADLEGAACNIKNTFPSHFSPPSVLGFQTQETLSLDVPNAGIASLLRSKARRTLRYIPRFPATIAGCFSSERFPRRPPYCA
jgi:hypothetical protein